MSAAKRPPTRHRIRQEYMEAEWEFEGWHDSPAFLIAVTADRLGVGVEAVIEALEEPVEHRALRWAS